MEKKMIWSVLVHLSMNQWVDKTIYPGKKPISVDEDFWNYIIEKSSESGINTIVLDVGGGICYESHPEIVAQGAWTKDKMRAEIEKCRKAGITLIPKLNFSTTHDHWLGEYSRMISTEQYYNVVKDLITETYELFDKQEYFHLGMDEEDAQHLKGREYAVYRQGNLYWHDLALLINHVKKLGAKSWIWADPLFNNPEQYIKRFSPNDALLSPWYYNAFRKEHYTPVESRAEYVAYYNEGEYAKMGIKFVEEDPFLVNVRKVAVPLSKYGYKYVPCASVFNRCVYNHDDIMEYFRDNVSENQILGFMSAPWVATVPDKTGKLFYDETFKFFKAAKEKFYA